MPRRLLGLAIRNYLLNTGAGSPYDFWKAFCKDINYMTVLRYFYILKRLGLIEVAYTQERSGTAYKTYYKIVEGKEDDPCWSRPQICLYPETRWGRKRYRLWKEGLLTTEEETPEEKK